jgi:hypothetical protein
VQYQENIGNKMNPNLELLARETKNPAVGEERTTGDRLAYSNGFECRIYEEDIGRDTFYFSARLDENQLCYHDGRIFCVNGTRLAVPMEEIITDIHVNGMCSNGKDLFVTQAETIMSKADPEANDTMTLFESVRNPIGAMTAINEKVWCILKPGSSDSNWYLKEYDIGLEIHDELDRSPMPMRAVCFYDGIIHWSKARGVYCYGTSLDEPIRVFEEGAVIGLTELNGRLLALVEGSGVYDVKSGKKIMHNEKAVAMCAVPDEYWKI